MSEIYFTLTKKIEKKILIPIRRKRKILKVIVGNTLTSSRPISIYTHIDIYIMYFYIYFLKYIKHQILIDFYSVDVCFDDLHVSQDNILVRQLFF